MTSHTTGSYECTKCDWTGRTPGWTFIDSIKDGMKHHTAVVLCPDCGNKVKYYKTK